jgi:phage terminase large subunit-like protein
MGNAKTTLAAKIGVHHLCSVPGAMVTIGAASRDQARICFERVRGFAQHATLDEILTVRHLELRHDDGGGLLRVVPSDGPRVHGLSSTLYIGDEVWAWPANGELLEAMQIGLIKRPDSKFLGISTAAAVLDSPLARLRARALAQPTAKRTGAVVEATGDLHWLESSLPDDAEPDDLQAVKKANPAPWITLADLRRRRAAIQEGAFAQFRACRWGIGEGSWLPAGAWPQCIGQPEFTAGRTSGSAGRRTLSNRRRVRQQRLARRGRDLPRGTAGCSRPSITSARWPATTTSVNRSTTRGG